MSWYLKLWLKTNKTQMHLKKTSEVTRTERKLKLNDAGK